MRRKSVLMGVVSAFCGVLSMPSVAAADATPFIVGGHDATETYSFMASLQQQGQHGCGASLIKPDWVVTAAHCVGSGPSGLTVRVGSDDHTTGGEEAAVTEVKTHDQGDIAVLKLDKQLTAAPIRIAADSGGAGTATRIIGWGQTCPESGCAPAPKVLQELDTQVVDDGKCSGITAASEICTDNPNGDSGACYGDSGGPQLKGTPGNWELIGATSRAGNDNPVCATGPSIYTDVVAFREWINQNTGG